MNVKAADHGFAVAGAILVGATKTSVMLSGRLKRIFLMTTKFSIWFTTALGENNAKRLASSSENCTSLILMMSFALTLAGQVETHGYGVAIMQQFELSQNG